MLTHTHNNTTNPWLTPHCTYRSVTFTTKRLSMPSSRMTFNTTSRCMHALPPKRSA